MYDAQIAGSPLGFNPLSTIKKGAKAVGKGVAKGAKTVAKGVAKGAKATGKGVAKGAKTVAKGAVAVAQLHLKVLKFLYVMPLQKFTQYVLHPALAFAIKPVTSRINTITTRRARKLSWDRRKSLTPTPAETDEAKKWTHDQLLHHRGLGGKLVSALAYIAMVGAKPAAAPTAGKTPVKPLKDAGINLGLTGVEEAVIAAAIPVAIAIVSTTATRLLTRGAPNDPRGATASEQAAAQQAEIELARLQQEDAAKTGASGGWSSLPTWAKVAIPVGGVVVIGGIVMMRRRSSSGVVVAGSGWGGYPT